MRAMILLLLLPNTYDATDCCVYKVSRREEKNRVCMYICKGVGVLVDGWMDGEVLGCRNFCSDLVFREGRGGGEEVSFSPLPSELHGTFTHCTETVSLESKVQEEGICIVYLSALYLSSVCACIHTHRASTFHYSPPLFSFLLNYPSFIPLFSHLISAFSIIPHSFCFTRSYLTTSLFFFVYSLFRT